MLYQKRFIFELSLHQCWSLGVSGNDTILNIQGAVGHDVVSEREREGGKEGRGEKGWVVETGGEE